MVTRQELGK